LIPPTVDGLSNTENIEVSALATDLIYFEIHPYFVIKNRKKLIIKSFIRYMLSLG